MAEEWVSPTGHNDPDSGWINEGNAYDDDLDSYTESILLLKQTWSTDLELTIPAILCDKIRIMVKWTSESRIWDIDVYDGSWHHVYEGTLLTDDIWYEKNLDEQRLITKAKIRCYNDFTSSLRAYFKEFDFWGEAAPPVVGRSFGYIIG